MTSVFAAIPPSPAPPCQRIRRSCESTHRWAATLFFHRLLSPLLKLPRLVASAAVATAVVGVATAALEPAAASARLSRRPDRVQTNRWASRNGGHATSSCTPPQASSSAAFGPKEGVTPPPPSPPAARPFARAACCSPVPAAPYLFTPLVRAVFGPQCAERSRWLDLPPSSTSDLKGFNMEAIMEFPVPGADAA